MFETQPHPFLLNNKQAATCAALILATETSNQSTVGLLLIKHVQERPTDGKSGVQEDTLSSLLQSSAHSWAVSWAVLCWRTVAASLVQLAESAGGNIKFVATDRWCFDHCHLALGNQKPLKESFLSPNQAYFGPNPDQPW